MIIKPRTPPVRPQLELKPGTPTHSNCFPLPKRIEVKPGWPRTDCFPIPKGTLSLKDRLVASRLPTTLGKHVNSLAGKLEELRAPTTTLRRGADGVMRGPEGQPLVTVSLNGRTAYVDPNTNQYYLASKGPTPFSLGGVRAKGPMSLPEGARFSNSYFTTAEVKELNRLVRPIPRCPPPFHPVSSFEPR